MKMLLALSALAMIASVSLAADGPVRHVVLFKFKADADKAQIDKAVEAFGALKQKIDLVETLEFGTDVSPEKRSKGFTHCWIATFKTAADRDAYLVHPEHKAFGAGLKGIVDDVLVVDFVPQK